MKAYLQTLKQSPAYTGFVLFIIVLIINIVIQTPVKFFTVDNISLIFAKNTPLILVTMGQCLLMTMGVFDISIGVQMSLANVIAIMLPQELGIPLPLAWAIALLAVVGLSAINGWVVAYLRIPALLAGFAMIAIVSGINRLIMSKPQGKVPPDIYLTYDMKIFGFIPFSFLILLFAVLLWMYLKRTKLIKYANAIGGNERNAYATGINSPKVKVQVYLYAGFLTGIAGLCMTAMLASGNPIAGEPYGLKTIAACILGGVALTGGWGTMACGIFGAGFLIILQNSVFSLFNLLFKVIPGFSVNSYWQNLVSDVIILLGLVATIFTVKSQQEAFRQGLLRNLSRAEDPQGFAGDKHDA